MTRKSTVTLLATGVLTAALAVALPVASATAARPLPGVDASTADSTSSTRTVTTTRTGPTGSLPPIIKTPIPAPLTLTGFTVTTDSVVGTAHLTYTATGSTVTVRWGDGATSTYNPLNPVGQVPTGPSTPGNVTLQHVYAAGSGSAFQQIVTAQVGNVSDSRIITVTPRFRVTQYQAYFSYVDHCDSIVESYSEWRIRQTPLTATPTGSVPGATKTWRQDRLTNGGIIPVRDFRVLAGSQLSVDATMAQGHSTVSYNVTELDPVYDDNAGTRGIDLHPSLGSRSVLLRFNDDSGCEAEIKADVNVQLLTPGLLSTGPVATS